MRKAHVPDIIEDLDDDGADGSDDAPVPKKPKHTKVDLRQKNKVSARRRPYSLFFKLTVIDTVLALRDERGPTFAATTKVAKD